MHVLLIHQAFTSLDEAGGTRHYEMAIYLVEHHQQMTVITSPVSYLTGNPTNLTRSKSAQQPAEGLTILRAYIYPALHRSFVHRVLSFISFMVSSFVAGLRVKGVTLVWGTSPPIFQSLTAWAVARLKRTPFLFEVRDLWPAFAVAVGVLRHPLLIKVSEWIERFLYAHADLVVVNSPGFITYVQQRGARRVELVPNGSEPEMFDPQADGRQFRDQYNLAGKFVVMYAGAHGLSNDLNTLLDAAAHLLNQAEISIVLVGAGKDKPALFARAAAMGLSNVIFTPPIPKGQMAQALAAADACIAILKPIELYKTVYPNKVFDYMAAGRPVILAIDGVIREVVEGAGAGIFVPPGDAAKLAEAINNLANDRLVARAMGLAGRRCVESRFNRPDLAGKLADLLSGLSREAQ
ncbi:MAG: glycosyltransferase WbuB [Chloroflexi bacterium RBG_16_52_11]|nr:MAG: glycosyltransferase WbuB [Chloroflexi bacterium RBG_16_52_11]